MISQDDGLADDSISVTLRPISFEQVVQISEQLDAQKQKICTGAVQFPFRRQFYERCLHHFNQSHCHCDDHWPEYDPGGPERRKSADDGKEHEERM